MTAIAYLHQDDRPLGNFHRLVAGDTLHVAQLMAGWQRTIKIYASAVEPLHPTIVELPLARNWSRKDITIINLSGLDYVLRRSGSDEIYGEPNGSRVVVRLTTVLSDCHDEPDGWAAT
jgi:hypothetical protein